MYNMHLEKDMYNVHLEKDIMYNVHLEKEDLLVSPKNERKRKCDFLFKI